VPGDGGVSLCQGDINVFNYLFRKGRLLSVVDWEQAHLGDFRSDIGQLVALSHLKGAPWSDPAAMPFVRAYAAAAGSEPVGLEYFRAFWLLQLGVIHAGWTALNGTAPWYGRPELDLMLRRALDELPQPGG
jgi:aminoglycoside phosphotransferase (APT) family kinase protein